MPLNLPDRLPAIELLKKENIFVIDSSRASSQDIRPLRIVILNLMPLKITTETDLVRLLSNTPLQVEVSFMKVKGHTSKNTPVEHMKAFYRDFELMKEEKFDGMIITGAPVEHLDYEEANYWDEIKEIFDWARTHVTSTLYICWAAQAGLYHYYGVPKYKLDRKMFGVFKQYPLAPMLPIFRGFDAAIRRFAARTCSGCPALRSLPNLLSPGCAWSWRVADGRFTSRDMPSTPPIPWIRNTDAT